MVPKFKKDVSFGDPKTKFKHKTYLIPDCGDKSVDPFENLEPRDVVGKVPGLGARHLLPPPPGLLGPDARPLDLVVSHPGEALGDQGREDATEQGSGEGGDDDGGAEDSLDGGLPVSQRGRGVRG